MDALRWVRLTESLPGQKKSTVSVMVSVNVPTPVRLSLPDGRYIERTYLIPKPKGLPLPAKTRIHVAGRVENGSIKGLQGMTTRPHVSFERMDAKAKQSAASFRFKANTMGYPSDGSCPFAMRRSELSVN